MKLTENFYLNEFTKSDVANHLGISNEPEDWQLVNIKNTCTHVLQPARNWLNKAIEITSGLRSDKLNKAIGGAKNSQHMKGEAADIRCFDNISLFNFIKNELQFDQLIAEHKIGDKIRWIHVSYKGIGNRNQVLIATKKGNKTVYLNYTDELFKRIYSKN